MKILLTGPVPPHPGGGAISRAQLASGFARAGHEVCVVAPITRATLDQGERFARAQPELRVVRYLLDHFEHTPFLPPPEPFLRQEAALVEAQVTALLESFAPDVVVVGRESFARYVPRLTRNRGVRSVLLVRGSPTGHILAGKFPERDAAALLAEFRKVDRIIAVARHLADGLAALGFDDVAHIPNAIDTALFTPRPRSESLLRSLGVGPEATVVLVPANLHHRKRPQDVVRSARIVLERRPDLVYVFAGTGVLRDQIERLSREQGVSSRFRFLGWLDYERMPELMSTADLVVMASESEGMSRAYLEAMASERLLLASDIPSARELVEDGVNGLLFRVGDVEQLAARTLEAVESPVRRAEIGRRARATLKHSSVEEVVPLYLRELHAVVRRAPSAVPRPG